MAVGETGGLGWGGVASVAAVGVRHFLAFYSLVSSSRSLLIQNPVVSLVVVVVMVDVMVVVVADL